MTQRLIGETASQRRWRVRFLLLPTLLGAALALFLAGGALAVHDTGSFELDGNATTQTSHDWDQVCFQATSDSRCGTTTPAGATAASWTGDILNGGTDPFANDPNATIFTGGGSKDPIDISSWAWKDGAGGLPDKDNLNHSFAARYSLPPDTDGTDGTLCPSGTAATCDVLYFGSDRFDNSGDAQQGFWFFQNKITLGTVKSGGGFNFSGVHKTGDLLVISDFSNGGTTSTISVFKWNPAVSGNLELLETSTNANCATAGPGDAFCGIVNPGPGLTTAPWPYTDKSGNHNYLNGEFYEGGVNLSTLGLSGECFSSVASETRSSTSTTATLKDFVLGQFAVCAPHLTTSVQGLPVDRTISPGTTVHDAATIQVTGASTPADATGTVDFFLCGPAASANPDCSTGGADAGSGKALVDTSNPANPSDGLSGANSNDVNTPGNHLAPGFYCFRAVATLTNYDSPPAFTNDTSECFRVRDTSTTTTAQDWLPNDTATVKLSDGTTNGSGSVTFTLYENGTCTAPSTASFGPITLVNGSAHTQNTTVYTSAQTISWRVTFTSSDPNVDGSTSRCETSSVSIDNTGTP